MPVICGGPMRLDACKGRLVRVKWRDIVEDPCSSGNLAAFRETHRDFARSWTTGVLIDVDGADLFIATTLGVSVEDASEKGNSVIQIPRALVEKVYLLKHARQVSLREA